LEVKADSDPDPVPDPGVLMTKNRKKITTDITFPKIAIYLFLAFHNGRPSYRKSLLPSKENIHPCN